MAQNSKKLKSADQNEDRISDLPDHLLHRILSFLPSTQQAIKTGILSKRWRKQWTQVPVLIFHSPGVSRQHFIDSVDNALTLHECSKIDTFHLRFSCHYGCHKSHCIGPHIDENIRFATARQVEDLTLSCAPCRGACSLPEFLFNTASLVRLTVGSCSLEPAGKVSWVRLRALNLAGCKFSNQSMQCILSGSPLLESFELKDNKFEELVIASKSLKKLVLDNLCFDDLEISCPSLEKLSVGRLKTDDPQLFGEAIDDVLANSLLLESLTVHDFRRLHLPVIASQSLKRLVMSNITSTNCFELSCQKLEELRLLRFISIKNKILRQLQHVKELRLGRPLLASLKLFEASYPVLHIKCLILEGGSWTTNLTRVACLLRNCSVLESLTVTLFFDDAFIDYIPEMGGFEEDYWSSNAIGFSCLVSHLKTITIHGIPKGDRRPKRMLDFIQFLLNNSRVLERMTVVLPKTCHTDYTAYVSQRLSVLTRRSEHAAVELISECF